ncbi:DUF4157 domain-containing protein [Ascidiimonas sp. W6]|uniref:eCIS core domain-containing protein n=1 Tax=Ascidiimonas meishanensis TaxID=3128903 RepID=UPI0030EC37EC
MKTNKHNKEKQGQSKKIQNNALQMASSQPTPFIDKRPESKRIAQLQQVANQHAATNPIIQQKTNNTGLPDNLKSGIEQLSGMAMDDVKVHYNSPKPAQLQAHAYAQGTQIHVASGQEKHVPHEAWHVVQQKQGRVKPTRQLKEKVAINDDAGLEKEADIMGAKALHTIKEIEEKPRQSKAIQTQLVAQRVPAFADGHWTDTDINATEYDTFLALATANMPTYEGYDAAHLKALFVLFREHLTPLQLQGLISDNFKATITAVRTRVNVRTIRLPGVTQGTIDANIRDANTILARYNINVHIAGTTVITQEQLGLGLPSLDADGKLPKDTEGEDDWNLIGQFIGGNVLPMIWVPDFTGHGWFSKPSAITKQLAKGVNVRTMVIMRPGQTGQTLAHEMGHAMGGILGPIQHGQHVDDFNKLNLMHSDPIIHAIHKNLAREQIAAFKGSPFVTLIGE